MDKLEHLLYDTVYVLLMHRYADEEGHSYVEGVYTTYEQAEKNKPLHEQWRDNKYTGKIVKLQLNKPRYNYND